MREEEDERGSRWRRDLGASPSRRTGATREGRDFLFSLSRKGLANDDLGLTDGFAAVDEHGHHPVDGVGAEELDSQMLL